MMWLLSDYNLFWAHLRSSARGLQPVVASMMWLLSDYNLFWAHLRSSARGLCPVVASMIASSVDQNLHSSHNIIIIIIIIIIVNFWQVTHRPKQASSLIAKKVSPSQQGWKKDSCQSEGKGKVYYGQKPPSGESTTTECGSSTKGPTAHWHCNECVFVIWSTGMT